MPAPTESRDAVLKYLRNEFPFQRDLRTAGGRHYAYPKVKKAFYALVEELKKPKPKPDKFKVKLDRGEAVLCVEHFVILSCYMNTRLTRTRVAETVDFDQSTVKRKLDAVADRLLETLADQPEDHVLPKPGRCEAVLSYVRNDFLSQSPFEAWDGQVVPFQLMRKTILALKDNDPEHLRILNYFMNKDLTRTKIATAVDFDQSTVKRKLEAAASTVMNRVFHADFWERVSAAIPGGLFQNRNPYTGETTPAAFPVTNWWTELAIINTGRPLVPPSPTPAGGSR